MYDRTIPPTLTVVSWEDLPQELRDSVRALKTWAGLGEYEFPAVTIKFRWDGGHAYSAVYGRGGRAATVVLLAGSSPVICEGSLMDAAREVGFGLPDWAPVSEEAA